MDATLTLKLSKDVGNPLVDISSYHCLVGQLLYPTTTRPNIAYSVQQLSQFLSWPIDAYQQSALKVLKNLKGSPGKGLFFSSSMDLKLKAFSGNDWAGYLDSRRVVTSFFIYLCDALISWKSKKQSTIPRSSFKVKYRALATTICELQWL